MASNKPQLGEVYHADLNSYGPQLKLKGKTVNILYSMHVAEFGKKAIYEVDLRMLGQYHPDCYVANDVFFYGSVMKQYIDIWDRTGDAYKESGFYHFVTQMGEDAPEIK